MGASVGVLWLALKSLLHVASNSLFVEYSKLFTYIDIQKTETEEHLKVFLSVLMDVINISKNPHLEGKPYAKKKVMRQLLQTEVQ